MLKLSVSALVALLVGCASTPPVARQVPVDASNVAAVQMAGYKVVNKDGEKLYCRTDNITGSRVRTRTQCLTEQELFDQINDTQRTMTWINRNGPGPNGH